MGDATRRAKGAKNKLDQWRVDPDKRNLSLPPYTWLRCLSVSFLSSDQAWCEKNLHYKLRQGPVELQPHAPAIRGQELHMQRALELDGGDVGAYEYGEKNLPPVEQYAGWVKSMADGIKKLVGGEKVRAITLFGYFPDIPRVVVGNLEELEFDKSEGILYLREFKSRVNGRLPTAGLLEAHKMQVQIYRYLFDQLVDGRVDVDTICKYWEVDPKEELNESKTCLDSLLRELFAEAKTLPKVSVTEIVYAEQVSGRVFDKLLVPSNETGLAAKVERFSTYWSGKRAPVGVDIEEAGKKCRNCDFLSTCDWKYKSCGRGRRFQ